MCKHERTPGGKALTALALDLFRLNSRMLTAGDRLVADLGLTSARWQVLGTIVAAIQPQPVAWIARDMGGNRQNIQRIVNDLEKKGLVAFEPNPHHKRASLVVLTDKGKQAYEAAMHLQAPWFNSLAQGLSVQDIETTHRILRMVHQKLEEQTEQEQSKKG